jgi:hypothetical protein
MEIINQIAGMLGLSSTMFIVIVVAAVLLLGGLTILKAVVKFAWRTFITIFVLIVLLLGGLYIGTLMLANVH